MDPALALIFMAIVLTVWLLGKLFVSPQDKQKELRVANVFGPMTQPLAMALPISDKKQKTLKKELVSAGYYNTNALINLLSQRNLATMFCVVATGVCVLIEVFPGREWSVMGVGIALSVCCYSIPAVILATRAKARSKKIEHSLPDALDMISMSIEGGVPLQRSIKLVAEEFEETHRPLSRELGIIARQTQTGSLDQALVQFADRIDSPEVIAWSSMLKQGQILGVGLVDSMREYADRIRENRKQDAEQAGQTATIKLLLPVVFCLAPPIFILLTGPAILDLRDFINRERDTAVELVEQVNDPSQRLSEVRQANR